MKSPLAPILFFVALLGLNAGQSLADQFADPVTASKQKACRVQMQTVASGLEAHMMQEGLYPSSLDALVSQRLLVGPVLDPWGHPFEYALKNGAYELRSRGADGLLGTADDLVLASGRVTGGLPDAPTGPPRNPVDMEISLLEQQITQRNWGAAARTAEALLPRLEKNLGPRHPKTIRVQLMAGTAAQWGASDLARAEALFRQAVAGAEALMPPDHLLLAGALDHVAGIYESRGESATARAFQDRSLELLEKRGIRDEALMIAITHRGQYRLTKGELQQAAADFRQSLVMAEPLGHRIRTVAMTNLAIVEIRLGLRSEAEQRLREALRLRKDAFMEDADTRNIRMSLAALALEAGKLEEASTLLYAAVSAKDLEARLLAGVGGHVESRLDFGRVAAFADLAWVTLLRAKTPDDITTAMDLRTSADLLQEKLFAHVLPAASEDQRRAQLARVAELDEAGLTFALKTDNRYALEDAALRLIRSRGRALELTLRSLETLRARAGQNQSAFQQLAQIRARIAAESLAGKNPEPALMATARDLEVSLGESSALLGTTESEVTLDSLIQALPDNGVLVQFVKFRPFTPTGLNHWSPARYGAFLVRRGMDPRVTWVDLGPAATIEPLIIQAREKLQSPQLRSRGLTRKERANPTPSVDALKSLYSLLISPLKNAGAGSRWLLALDGALSALPFAALVDADGRFLIETTELAYLSNARSLLRSTRTGTSSPPVLFGNAAFGMGPAGMRPEPLPGTAEEVRVLASLLPGARVRKGAEASESALKGVHSPEILHLATHGFFLADDEKTDPWLRSGLLLAPSKQDDGILTALEAASLDLVSTRLVTLSACETGLGVARDTEGVYGLPRAMELAGAHAVVMTLWQVDDAATQAWMTEFYKLLQSGRPTFQALREVQLQFLKRPDWRHPYFWAPFIATGAPGKNAFTAIEDDPGMVQDNPVWIWKNDE